MDVRLAQLLNVSLNVPLVDVVDTLVIEVRLGSSNVSNAEQLVNV